MHRQRISFNSWAYDGEGARILKHGTCMVELDIDLEGLSWELGRKAVKNKNHRAREVCGLVEATVTEIKYDE